MATTRWPEPPVSTLVSVVAMAPLPLILSQCNFRGPGPEPPSRIAGGNSALTCPPGVGAGFSHRTGEKGPATQRSLSSSSGLSRAGRWGPSGGAGPATSPTALTAADQHRRAGATAG